MPPPRSRALAAGVRPVVELVAVLAAFALCRFGCCCLAAVPAASTVLRLMLARALCCRVFPSAVSSRLLGACLFGARLRWWRVRHLPHRAWWGGGHGGFSIYYIPFYLYLPVYSAFGLHCSPTLNRHIYFYLFVYSAFGNGWSIDNIYLSTNKYWAQSAQTPAKRGSRRLSNSSSSSSRLFLSLIHI